MSEQHNETVSMEQMALIWGGCKKPGDLKDEASKTYEIGDAICAACGGDVRSIRDGIHFKCFNSECTEFNKPKTAQEVIWR